MGVPFVYLNGFRMHLSKTIKTALTRDAHGCRELREPENKGICTIPEIVDPKWINGLVDTVEPGDLLHFILSSIKYHHPGEQALLILTPADKASGWIGAICAKLPSVHGLLPKPRFCQPDQILLHTLLVPRGDIGLEVYFFHVTFPQY